MSDKALEIFSLSFSYGGKRVLDDVSLTVAEGEKFSIVGSNGAGKSTLIKIIAGILKKESGFVKLFGQNIENISGKERAKLLGYVPQDHLVAFPYTVGQFVMMGRYPHLSPFTSVGAEDEKAVQWAMDITETVSFKDRSLETLSGGERSRVLIAAALAQGASAIALDEPTAFLDPKGHDEIFKTLSRVNREAKVTMLMVTHDINCAAIWSDTVLAIKDGKVSFAGSPSLLMQGDTLKEIYGKEFIFTNHPVTGKAMIVPDILS